MFEFPNQPEKQEEPIRPEKDWEILPKQAVEVISTHLSRAVEAHDITGIKELFSQPGVLRSLVVERGVHDQNLELLERGFGVFVQGDEKILETLTRHELPEAVLSELVASAYHRRDKEALYSRIGSITENEGESLSQATILRAQHDLASWKSTVEGKKDEALQINKEVLTAIREGGLVLPTLEQKVRYGIAHNKSGLKPAAIIGDFQHIQEGFLQAGDVFDAIRAEIEIASASIELARRQVANPVRRDEAYMQLEVAERIAEKVSEEAFEMGYANAEVLANELFVKIYTEMKNPDKVNEFRQKADWLRKRYNFGSK